MEENKKIKILVYGDEAIDIHLLIDSTIPDVILNEKLNGQSVKMINDRTGHKLIGDLITDINKALFADEKDDMGLEQVYQLCSCSEKANYAYYIWNKKEKYNHKEQFLGAKFDWLKEHDKEEILKENILETNQNLEDINILIFYDRHYRSGIEGCRDCINMSCAKNYEFINNILDPNRQNPPIIFIRTANEKSVEKENDEIKKTKEIISKINNNEELRKNTIVLIKLNDLKELGAQLPAKYSWEELVRSTYTELKRIRNDRNYFSNIVMAPLIIVDFDYDGYAAFDFTSESEACYLVYNKSHINGTGFKEISNKGSIPSSTSILQSIIVNFMIENFNSEGIKSNRPNIKAFKKNLPLILKICYLTIYYYCMVGRELLTEKLGLDTFNIDKGILTSFIKEAYIIYSSGASKNQSDSTYHKFILEKKPGFIILDKYFLAQNSNSTLFDVIMSNKRCDIFKLCKDIVGEGLTKTEIPFICFKELVSIDKAEMESYRHIYSLMSNKIAKPAKDKKPLSFCVFGKPGSGKSFGVKQISKELGQNKILNFNLSQMNDTNDLYNAFVKISDLILAGVFPVVFWDEFDSTLNGKKYGWLKYFLAPMEDGEYYANNTSHNVGSCIFVFAGSNAQSWSDFVATASAGYDDGGSSDLSKITDFISRISGYINVLGPNKDGDDNKSYKLRRSVFIRKSIEKNYNINKDEHFHMDEDILRALINVDCYKHGNRSLSKLIEQFKINSGDSKHIKKYCIPNQLDLYVDKSSFEEILKSPE